MGLRKDDFAFMLDHLSTLVVKTTGDSGGYNMLMGPFASRKEIDAYATQMKKAPGNYIAQPLIELSSHPDLGGRQVRATADRPAAVHPLRREHPRAAGRAHPRGPAARAPTS